MKARLLTLRNIPNNTFKTNNIVTEDYTVLPNKFTSMENWPKHCNLNCYTCTNHIQYIPLFIPAEVDNNESNPIERFNKTVYCSPSCVAAAINKMTVNNIEYYMRQLRMFIYRIIGLYMQMIEISDDRSVMDIYGGEMTKKEYRDKIYLINHEYFDIVTKLV